MSWMRSAGVGFARTSLLVALSWCVPVLALGPAAAGAALGSPWSWTNLWSWVGLGVLLVPLSLVSARGLGRRFRVLVGRWTGVPIEDGYRGPGPEPVQLSTGFWWNGYSYERSRHDAESDARWRRWLTDPAYRRDVRWLAVAAFVVGPVCALPGALLAAAGVAVASHTTGAVVLAVALVLVAVLVCPYAWKIVAPLGRRYLALSDRGGSTERVQELERQRADLTATQAAEIQRIERNLHDGAQARMVAVGLSLATAERLMSADPKRAMAMLKQARQNTSRSLAELRDLVRGITPPVLVERGAVDAIRALTMDSQLDVRVDVTGDIRLETPTGAALYFAVAELLANAAKHAPTAQIRVTLRAVGDAVEVVVTDDGPGGARVVAGGGLDGVRRRLAAFDGTVSLDSPPGGPTRTTVVVSCVSS